MRSWLTKPSIALGFALAAIVSAAAQPAEEPLHASTPEVKKAVVAAIEGQLAAFRAGDVMKAYGFSAAPLRAQTSLRTFVAIVQANYPEIWGNKRAEYGLVRDDGRRARVLVAIFSADGQATFDFVLLRERGGWRIGSILRHDARARANA